VKRQRFQVVSEQTINLEKACGEHKPFDMSEAERKELATREDIDEHVASKDND